MKRVALLEAHMSIETPVILVRVRKPKIGKFKVARGFPRRNLAASVSEAIRPRRARFESN